MTIPARPYEEAANWLGQFAPIQLIAIQFREAKSLGLVREAAMDSLSRNLVEQLPHGWGSCDNADWQAIKALSSWSSEIQVTGELDEYKSTLLAIAKELRALPPPVGWVPSGPDDPLLVSIFDLQWPDLSK
jgi:hypothetical protein